MTVRDAGSGGGNVKPPSDGPTAEEVRTATAAAAALVAANLALLHKETERVAKKHKAHVSASEAAVDGALAIVRRARSRLAETSDRGERRDVLDEMHASLIEADYASQVAPSSVPVKELHACVGKLGKAIDKVFTQACPTETRWHHPMDAQALRQAITQHLFRQGHFEMGDAYCESTAAGRASDGQPGGANNGGAPPSPAVSPGVAKALKAPFTDMRRVTAELENHRNLEPLARWIEDHRVELTAANGGGPIPLEFHLHKLRFMRLLIGGSGVAGAPERVAAAVAYSRAHFAPFAKSHARDIQRLMAATVFARTGNGLERSPYADLLRDCSEGGAGGDGEGGVVEANGDSGIGAGAEWLAISREFRRACCGLTGQPAEPPLLVTVNAGYLAMPTLLKLSKVVAANGQDWNKLTQLPVEIDLGREYFFHSIFACPVARDQAAPDNPPMILPCGLVLCRGSIQKMMRGNARTFKCPYCPVETSLTSCRQVFF